MFYCNTTNYNPQPISSGVAQMNKQQQGRWQKKRNGENNRDLIVCKNTVGSKPLMGY